MRHVLTPSRLLDRLVLLWVMPPLGFLITVLQVPELRYLNANHVLIAVLLAAIAVRWQLRALPQRVVLYLLLVISLTAAFMGIEWLHILAGRETIDGLTDLRMIIYSPFYGSIILFVLYAMYLTMLSAEQKKQHLGYFVRLMCWFHLFFLAYWSLLYAGWIEAIPRADLLHSNSVAYSALFVLCIMLFYRADVGLGKGLSLAFLAVNIAVILVNQTRGAIIALAAVVLYLLLEPLGNGRRATLTKLMLGALVGLGLAFTLVDGAHVLGRDVDSLGMVLDQIADAQENKANFVGVSPALVSDESSLSAFSRIGSSYYSLLSFLDNPMLGIGQAESYAIDVLGAGIHSLHFLIASSTGLLGLSLFAAMLVVITSAQGPIILSRQQAMMFILSFGYVLVYINSLPTYYALVLAVLGSQRKKIGSRVLAGAPGYSGSKNEQINVAASRTESAHRRSAWCT
ncbi:MAG: hypothetical protein K9J74_00470 [Sulfuritalea sp.]|nr:hypothetical protein [Sulfuritalea sp.]